MLYMLLSKLGWKEYENKPHRAKYFIGVCIHLSLRMATQRNSNSVDSFQEQ